MQKFYSESFHYYYYYFFLLNLICRINMTNWQEGASLLSSRHPCQL